MNPRDTIAAILKVRDENVLPSEVDDNERDASADAILSALTAADHRIAGPADMEAVEAARKAVEELANTPMGLSLSDWSRLSNTILSALAAPHMPVPDGWVLVPEEPTDEMTEAASDASEGFHEIDGDKGPWLRSEGYAAAYRAMLSAAPKPAALTQEPKP